jgi:hypothetical protein
MAGYTAVNGSVQEYGTQELVQNFIFGLQYGQSSKIISKVLLSARVHNHHRHIITNMMSLGCKKVHKQGIEL